MLTWLLVVVFFIGIVVSYVAAKKTRAAWGKPVMVVCTLCLVLVVLDRAFFKVLSGVGGKLPVDSRAVLGSKAQRSGELMGQGLKQARLKAGARILILGPYPPQGGPDSDVMMAQWDEGLTKGLGDSPWTKAGYFGPAPGTAESLSEGIAGYEGEFDAVVSFNGLPKDLSELNVYQLSERPMVGGFFEGRLDLETIRGWLKDGLIQAAVLKDEAGELKLYTPGNLP